VNVQFRALVPVDLAEVVKHLPMAVTTDTAGLVAYDPQTQEYLAFLICQDWTETSVQVHQVILKSMVLRHGWLEECATYVFSQAGKLKMYGLVPANNETALSMNTKSGFKELIRLEDAYAKGVDFVLMELKREDCPFWKTANEMAA
jgi:hypothetical protein